MTTITELADEVRILELEEKKLELENSITQLKAKQFIDEECVGCAGPCMVVDVAANLQEKVDRLESDVAEYERYLGLQDRISTGLQKELDECHETIKQRNQTLLHISVETDRLYKIINDLESKLSERPDIGMLNCTTNIEKVVLESPAHNDTIEALKDKNIEDLKELYNIYEDELRGIKADRTSIKSDRDIMFQNYRNTVAKLQEDIRDLEAELSARKNDSEVLMEVVDVANRWSDERIASRPGMNQIAYIIKDYHDAPEGLPEISIDEPQEITVTIAFLELP